METPAGDALQARTWDEFIGQEAAKRHLYVRIRAALTERRLLGHVLLDGPPGFGKTTIAQILSQQMSMVTGGNLLIIDRPVKFTVFVAMLRQFPGGMIFMDEIHRYSESQQNDLLTLLAVDPMNGYLQLPNGRRIKVPATFVGATTEREKLIPPLYDRFQIKPYFEPYTDAEMGMIVAGMASRLGLKVPDKVAEELGRAAGGVPRNAGALVLAARDLACDGKPVTVAAVLEIAGVDPNGLNRYHVEILRALDLFDGRAGLTKVASMLRLHPSVVADHERLLFAQGLIEYGDRGRELTTAGYARLASTQV